MPCRMSRVKAGDLAVEFWSWEAFENPQLRFPNYLGHLPPPKKKDNIITKRPYYHLIGAVSFFFLREGGGGGGGGGCVGCGYQHTFVNPLQIELDRAMCVLEGPGQLQL